MNIYFLLPPRASLHYGFHNVYLQLVLFLKEKYSANLIFSDSNDYIFIEKYNHQMRDCELIIDDEENDRLIILSFCESRNWGNGEKVNDVWNILTQRNNSNDIILITHYTNWFHKDVDFSNDFNFKVLKTTFYPFNPWIYNEHFYHLRKLIKNEDLIDNIFYLSTTRREDPYKIYELGYGTNPDLRFTAEQYLENAIKHKVGLAISSSAELCYREIDYMAVGLPTLRLEYMITTNPPLIANYHYISVDREKYNLFGTKDNLNWGPHYDREGGEKYVKAYIERFLEVKDDYDFLSFISKNAYQYFKENSSPENKMNKIIKILNF